MTKKAHSLYIADQHMVLSDVDEKNGLETVLSLSFDDKDYEKKFSDFLSNNELGVISVFVDLMSEELKHEHIPHITGSDRELLLERKYKSLFPDADLTWKVHLRREKTGRKDDLYLLTGISLTPSSKIIFDALIQTQQQVKGIYSMPILQQRLNMVLPDNKQYLLISRVLGSQESTNTYRQAYYKNRELIVCRVNSVSAKSGEEEFDQLFNEIERTHQFLSGTNQLNQEDPLSVISILGEEDSARLFDHTAHVNIELRYANLSELSKRLGIKRSFAYTNLPKLMCELAVTKQLNPHFRPKELCETFNTNTAKKRLLLSSVGIVLLSLLITTGLVTSAATEEKEYRQVTSEISRIEQGNRLLAEQIPDTDIHPKIMYQAVQLYQDIDNNGHKPDEVLEIIARAYSGYQDLQLNEITWVSKTNQTGIDDGDSGGDADGTFIETLKTPFQLKIVIRAGQTMSNRKILSRVEDFSASLLQQPEVKDVTRETSAIDTRTSAQLEESFGPQQQEGTLADFTLLVTM